jgi:hypothetical protein
MLDVHLGYLYARGRTRRRIKVNGPVAPRRRPAVRALRALALGR